MIFYVIGNGLGNIIQTTPAFRYLKKQYGHITVVTHEKYLEFAKAVYLGYPVITGPACGQVFKCCSPNDFRKGGGVSEVELNLRLVGCANPEAHKTGFCGYEEAPEEFDILLCDGYNKRTNMTDWAVKSYPYWPEVASELSDYRVASIGAPGEHIAGTIDRTGIGLLKSFGLIKKAKLLVCNDTGFYHAANALGTRCAVIITMTDRDKNHDPGFHRHTTIISTDLPCQPCQLNERAFWLKNQSQCQWACREIPIKTVIEKIRNLL